MNQEVQNWFDGEKDYQAGLVLLRTFSKNRSLFSFLSRKEKPEKLEYELQKLLQQPTQIIDIRNTKKSEKPIENTNETEPFVERVKITEDGKIRFDDLPEPLQEYYLKIKDEYKFMRSFHEKMKLAETDDARANFRQELVTLDDSIAEKWKAIDLWTTTGELPEELKEAKPKPAGNLTVQEVNTNRTAVTRSLAALENEETPEAKKEELLSILSSSAQILLADGQGFKPETIERIKKLIPDFNEIFSNP